MKLAGVTNRLGYVGQQRVFAREIDEELMASLAESPRVIVDDIGVDARLDPSGDGIGEDEFPQIISVVQLSVLIASELPSVESLVRQFDRALRDNRLGTATENSLRGFVLSVPVLTLVRSEVGGDASYANFSTWNRCSRH